MWHVTDDATLQWVLPRLRPTPVEHFTEPIRLTNAGRARPHRVYIRCPQGPAPFDKPAAIARASPDWTYRELRVPHVPFITHPRELTQVLIEVAFA